MAIQRINPDGMSAPIAPYTLVVRKDNVVSTAGMLAFDGDGNLVGDDIESQTRQAISNVVTALGAAGATLDDVVKVTVFITDVANFAGMNAVYTEFFGDTRPARSTVRVDLVLAGALVEVEATAVVG